MRRYGLRDEQWDRIKDFLPGREGHVGGTAEGNRLFVEAVLYRYRTGCPWRDLPERFGHWMSPHNRRIDHHVFVTTSSPEIFSLQFSWSRLSSCSTEDRP